MPRSAPGRSRRGSPPPLRRTWPNGLELLCLPNPAAPVVALDLWVRVGSAAESPAEAGVSHLVEHMLFKGTRRRGPGELAREVEGVGGHVNAYTSFDHTVYSVTVASRYAQLGLEVLADAVLHSRFDVEELEREKLVVLEEIKRGRDLPHQYLSQLLFAELYREHPYGRPVIGTQDSVAQLTRTTCMGFWKRWYRAANLTLVVAGDVVPAEFAAQVEDCFGGAPARPRPRWPACPHEPAPAAFRFRSEARDVAETYFELAFPAVAASHPDVPALDLLVAILGQEEGSRLQHRVKLDRNLVHAVGAGVYAPCQPGLVHVGGMADPDRFPEAYRAICEELFRLCHERVGAHELRQARDSLEADFVYQRETVQGQAQKAGFFHVVLGDTAAEQAYLDGLAAVDTERLRAVARKYLRAPRAALAVLTPRDWEGGVAAEPCARSTADAAAPPPRRIRRAGRRSATLLRLANGVRLVVKRNPDPPLVALRAACLGGTLHEAPPLAGAFHALAETLTRGTNSRSVFDIAHSVDALGGQLEGFSGRNSFGLRAEFLSRNLAEALELFADVLCRPSFPETELAKVRADARAALRLRRDNPAALAFRTFEELLYHDHPYGRDVLGSAATLDALCAEDVATLYARSLRPESLVVAAAGDVDPDRLAAFLAHDLERLAPRDPAPAVGPPPAAVRAPRRRTRHAATEQAHVVVGFLGADVLSADRPALKVLNGILSGQGGRLFVRLRDHLGLAYSVSSTALEGLHSGYLATYAATDPERADQARDELLAECARLAAAPPDPAELERAKRKIVGSFEISLQESAFQAAQLALDEVYGAGFRSLADFARRVLAVDADALADVASRYLGAPPVCAVVGPRR